MPTARRASIAATIVVLGCLLFVPAAQAAEQQVIAADAFNNDQFATSVAIDGDVAVVGAPLNHPTDDRGAAYVFTRTGGVWTQAAKLTASDQSGLEHLGQSVAISGDTIVVGAPGDTVGLNASQGSAYVYVKPLGGWATTSAFSAKLTASDGAANDQFGYSVGVSGDTLVAGAPGDTTGVNLSLGSAYVFTRAGVVWTEAAKLTTSDGAANDQFGYSVGVSGATVAVGARLHSSSRGAAYVFEKPVGAWATTSTPTAKLTTSDGAVGDQLGYSIAIDGNTVVAGAPIDDASRGSAYVFVKPLAGWATTSTPNAKLVALLSATGDLAGWSIAIDGGVIVAGSPGDDLGGDSLYVFVQPMGGWSGTLDATSKLVATTGSPGPQKLDQMGFSAGVSAGTIIGGAPFHDESRGAAYIFDGQPTSVEVRSVSARRAGAAVRVRWRTGSEANVLAFNVYRQQGERRVRLNPAPIVARHALSGGSYSFIDRRGTSRSRYWLELLRRDGARAWRGPVAVAGT